MTDKKLTSVHDFLSMPFASSFLSTSHSEGTLLANLDQFGAAYHIDLNFLLAPCD
jgi:hypothetical protein